MKKFLAGTTGLGIVVGLIATGSVVYAGEPQPEMSEEAVYRQKVDEFHAVLFGKPGATIYEEYVGGDAVYQKAHDAAETYLGNYGDDGSTELKKLLEVRREVALSLYEQHFGAWEGTPSEFDEFFSKSAETPVEHCRKNAIATCGKGMVCWVKTQGESCGYACKVGSDPCPAYPAG